MPSASGTQQGKPPGTAAGSPSSAPTTDPDPGPGSVLAAERAHLAASRQYLKLMREDVLSLRALGGDPVSEEYLRPTCTAAPRRCMTCRTRRCSSAGSITRGSARPVTAEPAAVPPAILAILAASPASSSTSAAGTCTTRTGTPW